MENLGVAAFGGRPPKNQKIPINQAKLMKKNQLRRERKMLQEVSIRLACFGKLVFTKPARKLEKRKAWDRVLRATEGYFKNGVLNVKHLMEGHGTSKNG
ncbi:hypothetical protein AMTRI_Chr11g98530 [Amborella trichopoda]